MSLRAARAAHALRCVRKSDSITAREKIAVLEHVLVLELVAL